MFELEREVMLLRLCTEKGILKCPSRHDPSICQLSKQRCAHPRVGESLPVPQTKIYPGAEQVIPPRAVSLILSVLGVQRLCYQARGESHRKPSTAHLHATQLVWLSDTN